MSNPIQQLAGVGQVFGILSNPRFEGEVWKRIGTIALGTLLLIIGVVIMIEGTKAGQSLTGAAVKVAGVAAL